MYKKQVTYTDLDGNERTDTLYFRLSEAEVTEMEYSIAGGLGNMLMNIIDHQDVPAVMSEFKKFIMLSYGEKAPDGHAFIKVRNGQRLADYFVQTEAYNQFFISLFEDPQEMIRFINEIFPESFTEKGKGVLGKTVLTDNPTTQKLIDSVNAKLEDSGAK